MKYLKYFIAFLLIVGLCCFWAGCTKSSDTGETESAGLVIKNARVYTCNTDQPWAQAVAVRNKLIVYVGDDAGVEKYIGPDTRVINAKGNMLTPGFIDNHCHFLWMGALQSIMAQLHDAANMEQLKTIIVKFADNNSGFPFILGMGWKRDYIEGGIPDKEMADKILKDRPLILWAAGGHTGWMNTMAIEELSSRNPRAFEALDPVRDENTGEYTGVLNHFYSFNPFDYYTADELGAEMQANMMTAMSMVIDEALKNGVTSFHDMQIYKGFVPILVNFYELGGFDNIRARGALYIGNYFLEDEEQLDADLEYWIRMGDQYSDNHFIIGDSVKLYIDGVAGTRTSFMLEPYTDKPGFYGAPLWSDADFKKVCLLADSKRLQICTHATGDAGIRRVIDGYEYAMQNNGTWDSRHRIEHCELPNPADIPRMANLKIYAAMQESHFMALDDLAVQVWGLERCKNNMPWQTMLEAGVEISSGSDWMAAPMSPMYSIWEASHRVNYLGGVDWKPEERMTLPQVVHSYTIGSAKALKIDHAVGTIEVGKLGDMALFSVDLLDPDTWHKSRKHLAVDPGITPPGLVDSVIPDLDGFVMCTIVDGRVVYERGDQ